MGKIEKEYAMLILEEVVKGKGADYIEGLLESYAEEWARQNGGSWVQEQDPPPTF